MPYVSELIGAPIRDQDGHVVGRVTDLLVPVDADYPAIEAIALKPDHGDARTIPWSALRVLDDGKLGLAGPLAEAPTYESAVQQLSLARQVIDHQIIDVNGVRVVRVNDLQLAPVDGA